MLLLRAILTLSGRRPTNRPRTELLNRGWLVMTRRKE